MKIAYYGNEKSCRNDFEEKMFNVKEELSLTCEVLFPSSEEELLEKKDTLDLLFLEIETLASSYFQRFKNFNQKKLVLLMQTENIGSDFHLAPFRYLSTPIEMNWLKECMISHYKQKKEKLVITYAGQTHVLFVKDIVAVVAENKKSFFCMKEGKKIETGNSLLFFKKELAFFSQFIACNKGYIINVEYVEKLIGEELFLQENLIVPVAKKKKRSLIEKLEGGE